jgi:Retinitis pigmentosa G-protein regulator interacting C-terminal
MAIQAYKERSLRLSLNSTPEGFSEGAMNSLNVEVGSIQIQSKVHHPSVLKPFCVINFEHTQTSTLSQSMHGNTPNFGFNTLFPVKMTANLDRHLRTGKLLVTVADDGVSEIIYGYAKIPLVVLAFGEKIDGVFDLESAKGTPCGTIHVILNWSHPYLDIPVKTVTLLDDSLIRDELKDFSPSESSQPSMDTTQVKKMDTTQLEKEVEKMSAQLISDKLDNEKLANQKVESGDLVIDEISKVLEPPLPAKLDVVSFKISKLHVYFENADVSIKLLDVRQVFIGVELFNLPGEMLETSSMLLQNDMDITFGLDIPHKEILSLSKQQVETFIAKRNSEKLTLSLVDEPPADSEVTECKDIGFGVLELFNMNEGISKIPLFARDKNEEIGFVELQISGLDKFYAFCEELAKLKV